MYNYFTLPCPAPPSVVAAYKSLRLSSLKADPANFDSAHTREFSFTDDEWQKELDSASKRIFVASVSSASSSEADGESVTDTNSWVAIVTILASSEFFPDIIEPLQESGWPANWEPYYLGGFWVHPEHRAKGLGKELIKQGLEWARTAQFMETDEETERMVIACVHDCSRGAQALFTKLGFCDLDMQPWEGERCMAIKV